MPRAVVGVMRGLLGRGLALLPGIAHAAGVVGGDDTLAKYRHPNAVATLETNLLVPLTLTQALLRLARVGPSGLCELHRSPLSSRLAAHYGASKAALEQRTPSGVTGAWGGSASVLLPGSIGGGA